MLKDIITELESLLYANKDVQLSWDKKREQVMIKTVTMKKYDVKTKKYIDKV
jgi:hypothetical protein